MAVGDDGERRRGERLVNLHTYQGEQLGPFHLPSNVLGGLNSVVRGEGWHGPGNWNEAGPLRNSPRPWPVTKP